MFTSTFISFRYLTGIRVPGCAYLLHKTAQGNLKKILFMERRSEHQTLWEGPLPLDSVLESTAEFDELLSPKEVPQVCSVYNNKTLRRLF